MTPAAKALLVKSLARQVGFDLVGITTAGPVSQAEYYRDWLAAGYAGSMAFLHRNVRVREEPARLLPGARSIICLAVSCRRADGYLPPAEAAIECAASPGCGRVAGYARGPDYHRVLHRLLADLLARMQAEIPGDWQARPFVDTGPLLERALAASAGLGWIGRNTCLLNARLGSHLLLAELVTTLQLPPDSPVEPRCGRCTRCLDACPTGALVEPYRLDARKCIAYLTIEHRGEIAPELRRRIGDRLFGCDACQQVCPYNAKALPAPLPAIQAEVVPAELPLVSLLHLRAGEYRRLTRGTALRRASAAVLRRNALIVLGNAGAAGQVS